MGDIVYSVKVLNSPGECSEKLDGCLAPVNLQAQKSAGMSIDNGEDASAPTTKKNNGPAGRPAAPGRNHSIPMRYVYVRHSFRLVCDNCYKKRRDSGDWIVEKKR